MPVEARLDADALSFELAGHRYGATVSAGKAGRHEVFLFGETFSVEVAQGAGPAGAGPRARAGHSVSVKTPMPGRVVAVQVRAGDLVARGDLLLTLEAMKMQNEFHAPSAGRVAAVRVRSGQIAAAGDVLVEIAPESSHSRGGGPAPPPAPAGPPAGGGPAPTGGPPP